MIRDLQNYSSLWSKCRCSALVLILSLFVSRVQQCIRILTCSLFCSSCVCKSSRIATFVILSYWDKFNLVSISPIKFYVIVWNCGKYKLNASSNLLQFLCSRMLAFQIRGQQCFDSLGRKKCNFPKKKFRNRILQYDSQRFLNY